MSDWIRRDLEKFVNTDILNQNEELSFFGKLPKKLKADLIRWIEENDAFLSNQQNINTNIFSKSSKILEVNEENVFFLPSVFNCVDCILKTFLEVYESVVLASPTNPIYERFVHINRGRVIKIPFYHDIEHEYLNIIEAVRYKNAKILFINTKNYENEQELSIEIAEEIAKNMPKIIVIDDTQNDFKDSSYTKLVLQYENVIVLKSFSDTEGFEGVDGCFLISSKDIISDISSVTTKTIIKMDSVVTLFSLLSINDEIKFEDVIKDGHLEENYTDNAYVEENKVIYDVNEQNEDKIDNEDINDSNDSIIENNEEEIENENQTKDNTLSEEKDEEKQDDENDILDKNSLDNISEPISNDEVVDEKDYVTNKNHIMKKYEAKEHVNRLVENNRNSLIEEFTKYDYITIFSANFTHVYILSTIRIFNLLADEGVNLKRYNSSQGEILRLTIEDTSENEKILSILDDLDPIHHQFF